MNKINVCLVFLTAVLFLTPSKVVAQKTELNLWKFNEFWYGSCGFCGEFIALREDENLSSMTDFSLYNQDGYYTVILKGSSEIIITLFGANDFSTEQGFLSITKRDDKTISIDDLEAFRPNTWVEVEAKEGVSGAYSAYYHPYPRFKNNIRSVNWGHWQDKLFHHVKPPS